MNQQPLIKSYPLPFPFPDGHVWVAIRDEVVMNMLYMQEPPGVTFALHRHRCRTSLAKEGEVWTGKVVAGGFVPAFQSTDRRIKV